MGKEKMEALRKRYVVVVAVILVIVVVLAAVAYSANLDEEDEDSAVNSIVISGPDLPTSKLVDGGSGTADDPYVITEIKVNMKDVPIGGSAWGITVQNVSARLIISEASVEHTPGTPPLGYGAVGIMIMDSQNVTILNSSLEDLSIGVEVYGSKHVEVNSCDITGCSIGMLLADSAMSRSTDITILHNVFTYDDTCISSTDMTSDIDIDGNYFQDCNDAVRIEDSSGVRIVDNNSTSVVSQIVALIRTNNATIANNSLYGLNDAISMFMASDVQVTGNYISPTGGGVVASESNRLNISRNHIYGGVYGTHLQGINAGIWIDACSDLNVTWNVIVNNVVGIALISSELGNTTAMVHHNGLYSTGINAIDNAGSGTLWDDGVGQGNCWGDDYSRLNLTDANSDDILDGPYVIDADSQDRYPLAGSIIYYSEVGDIVYFPGLPIA